MHNIISVVTPSYNQAEFIGDTIQSILRQKGDFYIDYVIVDGASTDNSKDIIAGYEKQLKEHCEIQKLHGLEFYVAKNEFGLNRCKGISYRWMSEKDNGHAHALNKGFAVTKGDIMCWLNSDDMYHENAFKTIIEVFNQFDFVKWITGQNSILNKDGTKQELSYLGKFNYKNIYSFLSNDYEWIQQETTFWKRDLWVKAGSRINTDYRLMVDGELWCRFFLFEEIYHVNQELGGYRRHDNNRAHQFMPLVKAELKRAIRSLELQTTPRIKEIAGNLTDNKPPKPANYREINFLIIDKGANDSQWHIREQDFFEYSAKRHATKFRVLEREFDQLKSRVSNTETDYQKIISEKDEIIKTILNSYRYKTGKFVLAPLRFIKPLLNVFSKFFLMVRKSWIWLLTRNYSYPLFLNWKKITTPDRYIIKTNQPYSRIVLSLIRSLINETPVLPEPSKVGFLFIKSMIRQDYDDFFKKVYNQCAHDKAYIDIKYEKGAERKIIFILSFIWHLPIFFRILDLDVKSSLYCYLRVLKYLPVLKIINKFKFKHLVTFAEMQGVENMLIQHFKKKGVTTTTLQHGLYVDYKDYDNINRVNYENVVSHYFLAWGQETKELILRYHPYVNVVICGKPLFLIPAQLPNNYFTLVFDQLLFTEQNKELLSIAYKIANQFELKVNVRIHPWDKMENYNFDKEMTCFDKQLIYSRFVIGHTTSMVFECMRNGIPAFKYKTRFPSNVVHDDLTFANADDLMQRINSIKHYNFTEFGKFYIEHIGDESLTKYAEFFDNLSNKQ